MRQHLEFPGAILASACILIAVGAFAPSGARAQASQLDPTAAQVGAGYDNTCVLTAAGGVKCWGNNFYGQVGDNSNSQRDVPVDVSGLASGVAAIAVGGAHTCALTTGGAVKCWGNGYYGQLGENNNVNRAAPVAVTGLGSGVAAISAGGGHGCALTAGGAVKCWGENANGQAGDNSTTHRYTPVDVAGLASGVVAIAVGGFHSCALTSAGGVKCWGRNATSQLGDSTTIDRLSPVDVTGLASGVAAITAGEHHTCALMDDGGARCWGSNSNGQLGDSSTTRRATPTPVSGLASGVAAIAAGGVHTCAVTTTGAARCWGYNVTGQLGDNTTTQRTTPVDVANLASGIAAVAPGNMHTCALTTTGSLKCWGFNAHGDLGDGTTDQRNSPVEVAGFSSRVAAITTGTAHGCAITAAGGAKCWGYNEFGAIGDNSTATKTGAVDVSGLGAGVYVIKAGQYHTCALVAGNAVKCWGRNDTGQLGDNSVTQRLVPVDVTGLSSGVTAIGVGIGHSCAIVAGGALKCWGFNGTGALGDNTYVDRTAPVNVVGLGSGVIAVAPAWAHTCALVTGGGVKCWGSNAYGNLGGNPTPFATTPVDVPSLTSGVAAIASGLLHSCALTTGGGVKCWGYNASGQLGNNSTANSATPVDVAGLTSGVVAISAGDNFSCAITAAGGAKCWGENSQGQLGDNSTTQRLVPVDVSGLPAGVAGIDGGQSFGCALTSGGEARCWGQNALAQLGDGTNTQRLVPVGIRRAQSLAFTRTASLTVGMSATLSATATSALGVAFDTWTPATCSVVGATVTASAPGVCGLRARQAGDGHNAAAPSKSWLVPVFPDCGPAVAGDCDNDGIPNSAEPGEGRNPLAKDNDVFGNARLFAMQQYRDFLGREGDVAGLQGWTAAVESGGWSRAQVIDAFLGSQEFSGFVAPVVRLYFATFLRVPDYAGLTYNAGLVRAGTVTLAQLGDFFVASPEFVALHGSLDNTQFVTLLYSNVLGRTPDQAGLDGWVALLDGGHTRGQVLLGFSDSTEYQSAMANEVFVTMMYAGMLRRTPDAPGFSGWVGFLDAGTYTREQVINGFFMSTEYHGRFLP